MVTFHVASGFFPFQWISFPLPFCKILLQVLCIKMETILFSLYVSIWPRSCEIISAMLWGLLCCCSCGRCSSLPLAKAGPPSVTSALWDTSTEHSDFVLFLHCRKTWNSSLKSLKLFYWLLLMQAWRWKNMEQLFLRYLWGRGYCFFPWL